MSKLPTKEELLKLATKNLIVNKEVAKLAKTKTMTRRLKTNLKKGDVFWLREPARVEAFEVSEMLFDISYSDDDFNQRYKVDIPTRFYGKEWTKRRGGVPNGCIKEMARRFYQVTSVHSEPLRDISEEDCKKEGVKGFIDYREEYERVCPECGMPCTIYWVNFKDLWNSTAKAPNRWEDNPMVEVIEYKEIEYSG